MATALLLALSLALPSSFAEASGPAAPSRDTVAEPPLRPLEGGGVAHAAQRPPCTCTFHQPEALRDVARQDGVQRPVTAATWAPRGSSVADTPVDPFVRPTERVLRGTPGEGPAQDLRPLR